MKVLMTVIMPDNSLTGEIRTGQEAARNISTEKRCTCIDIEGEHTYDRKGGIKKAVD